MSAIIVLHAALPGHAPCGEAALLGALPYAKRLELERREPLARQASLCGIGLALECLARLRGAPVGARELRFPADGKPFVPGGPFFSISHTAGRVACAASVVVDCGLDLEALDGASSGPAGGIDRLRRWTAVEAVLKAAGVGLRSAKGVRLSERLSGASFGGQQYELRELSLVPGIIAHVAARGPLGEVTVEARVTARAAPAP